jgi:hydroxymethylpyrimidine pyrophosphatase-like HAD family hydrolase
MRAVSESLGGAVRVLRPAPGVIAVQDAAATKLDALRALAGRLRVDPAGVTYLGDDADDAAALAWAGFGVAVVDGDGAGDGAPEAVDAADLIVAPAQVPELLVQLALARRLRDAG